MIYSSLGMAFTYAGTLEQECRYAWETERLSLQRDLLLLGKRSREEEESSDQEEPPIKKIRMTANILPVSKKQPAIGISYPALTKKYLNFNDSAARAGGH